MAEFDEFSLAIANSWLDPEVLQTEGEEREALGMVIVVVRFGHAWCSRKERIDCQKSREMGWDNELH